MLPHRLLGLDRHRQPRRSPRRTPRGSRQELGHRHSRRSSPRRSQSNRGPPCSTLRRRVVPRTALDVCGLRCRVAATQHSTDLSALHLLRPPVGSVPVQHRVPSSAQMLLLPTGSEQNSYPPQVRAVPAPHLRKLRGVADGSQALPRNGILRPLRTSKGSSRQ